MEAYRRVVQMGGSPSDESMYALLAAICWLRGGSRQEARPFLDEALRKEKRDSLEYGILRMYRDWAGDIDIINRADREKNPLVKSRMLFYLAWYYEIRGNKSLAEKLFLQVRDLEVKDSVECRLNEWILNARGTERQ
jgi:hypothetical protein